MILNKFVKLMMDSLAVLCQFETARISITLLFTSIGRIFFPHVTRRRSRVELFHAARIDIWVILMAGEKPFAEVNFSLCLLSKSVCVAMKNDFM